MSGARESQLMHKSYKDGQQSILDKLRKPDKAVSKWCRKFRFGFYSDAEYLSGLVAALEADHDHTRNPSMALGALADVLDPSPPLPENRDG